MAAITFDPKKRDRTLAARGLDFTRADEVFAGFQITQRDSRRDYGEERFITAGYLDGRMVVVVWTPRDDGHRIISMRHANDRERPYFESHIRGS